MIKANSFPNILAACVGTAVDNYAYYVADKLKNNVLDLWYNEYTPDRYIRSMDVLNSIRVSYRRMRGGVGRNVYFDTSLIRPVRQYYRDKNGRRRPMHRHISLRTGSNTNKKIVDWMNSGFKDNMSFWGNDPRGEGVHFIEITQEDVEKNAQEQTIEFTLNQLKQRGIIARKSDRRREIIRTNLEKQTTIKVKR